MCISEIEPEYDDNGNRILDPKLKGKKHGNCNRTACQEPGADYRHRYNNMIAGGTWYCIRCAIDINKATKGDLPESCFELDLNHPLNA